MRFVGDPVALVVAESRAEAQDAAELIEVDYEILPSVTDTGGALDADAPVIWEEHGSNLCVLWDSGREAEAEAGFAGAAQTVSIELVQNRLVGNPMEPRVALGEYDAATESYTLHSPTQGVMRVQDGLAKLILKVPKEKLRVISPDVGGGFGLRGKIFPESGMVLWAAKKLGRPVKWISGRTETFQCDPHGRDHVTRAEMAFDADGKVLGRADPHLGGDGRLSAGFRAAGADGRRRADHGHGLRHPGAELRRCAASSPIPRRPTPIAAPAGRRQAYVLERLLDQGAAALGIGRDEIRRRNYIRPEQIPYTNVRRQCDRQRAASPRPRRWR